MSGFFALLDDIATLAKMTLATLDDTAGMAVKTSAKVSAAAVDDVAATPQYVTGITPERELPIIRKITLGSLRNKLLIILPLGMALTALAPWLLPVALIIGGTYLCYEAGVKVLAKPLGLEHGAGHTGPLDEASVVRQAVTTDFVLSTEIMLLALAEVQGESSVRRVAVLVLIALLVTFAVYGLVAVLIKLDDAGVRLAASGSGPAARRIGRAVVASAPGLFSGIGVLGTVAMLWVGGQILAHNLAEFSLGGPYHLIETAHGLSHNPVLAWLAGTGSALVFGAVVGAVLACLAALAARVRKLLR